MKGNRRVSLWNVLLAMSIIVLFAACPLAQKTPGGGGKTEDSIKTVTGKELKGVWELVIAATQQTSNIFLYFDGTKMYSAVNVNGQFAAVPQGTSVLEYKDGKLQYGAAGMMAEFVGKKNGENIDLYAKANGQTASAASYTLKPSTVNKDSIKNVGNGGGGNNGGNSGGGEQPGGQEISSEELKGVWELVIAATQQTSNIFLYFDGTKMYSAVNVNGQFAAVPQGTPFLEYKDGKLQYGIAGTMVEYIGKKNGKHINLYVKTNGQIASVASHTLKPSTESAEAVKEAGSPLFTPNGKLGTIVLKNGTYVEQDSYTAIDSTNPPIAVLIGIKNAKNQDIGIGLHTKSALAWANKGSTGQNTQFKGLICIPNKVGREVAATVSVKGDTDGSDNWEYICKIDPEGTANSEPNYPAFHWVNHYGTMYDTGSQKWYIPSLAELCAVYKNREVINASLAKIHGLDSIASENSLAPDAYWSSSQAASKDKAAWLVGFGAGYVGESDKDYNSIHGRVCCLTGF